MKTTLLACIALLIPGWYAVAQAPDSLSLGYCYQKVEANYPVVQKRAVQQKIAVLNDRIARSALRPDLNVSASASYQSDVTEVPFSAPGTSPTQFSKDHYNVSVGVTQAIYDGGHTAASRKLEKEESLLANIGVETTLWQVRGQTEQVYFSILYLRKKEESLSLLIEDLQQQLQLIHAKVEQGVLLKGNANVLEAEVMKVKQQRIQNQYDLTAAFRILSELTGESLSEDQALALPTPPVKQLFSAEISRPELKAFDAQKQMFGIQQELSKTGKRPLVSAFATTAYGRPGLNMFDDNLQAYWIVGLKAQWGFRNWRNAQRKSEALALQKVKVQADADAFRLRVRSSLNKIEQQIKQLQDQIKLDKKIVALRKNVVQEKKNQLAQGAITSTEYITELNAESQAWLNLKIREVRLIQAKIEYSTQKGISWN
jgi:outer membrane protein TolC